MKKGDWNVGSGLPQGRERLQHQSIVTPFHITKNNKYSLILFTQVAFRIFANSAFPTLGEKEWNDFVSWGLQRDNCEVSMKADSRSVTTREKCRYVYNCNHVHLNDPYPAWVWWHPSYILPLLTGCRLCHTWLQIGNTFSNTLHNTGCFMTRNDGKVRLYWATQYMVICAADSSSQNLEWRWKTAHCKENCFRLWYPYTVKVAALASLFILFLFISSIYRQPD